MATSHAKSSRNDVSRHRENKPKILTVQIIGFVFNTFLFLFFTWILSIIIEWLGILFIWPEEGSLHSQRMLQQELGYLRSDFSNSVFGSPPASIAFDAALLVKYYVFEWTNLFVFYDWLKTPPYDASWARIFIARVAQSANEFFQASVNTTAIYSLRVTVATLSLPSFIFIGAAALIDGLVQREKRIYCGGVERSWVYHHAKPYIKPAIVTTWFFYLGIPIAIHPNLIFGPANLIFGMAIFITASLFKKHI